MDFYLKQLKKVVETHPDYIEGDFVIKHNKGFDTLYLCDIAVIKIFHNKDEILLGVAKRYYHLFGLGEPNDNSSWVQIAYNDKTLNTIYNGSLRVFKQCYKDSAEYTFGCCSRFIECSDAKKCICTKEYGFNNLKRFQSGCMYKDNLDQGMIFYGENRNYPPRGK